MISIRAGQKFSIGVWRAGEDVGIRLFLRVFVWPGDCFYHCATPISDLLSGREK